MKTKDKKVFQAFRLDPAIITELKQRSEITGISQARILEEALEYWFGEGMSRKLEAKLKMVRGRGFEPLTPTVSR